ncbi:MAG: hypothetical protein VX012_09430 [Planctomycetota bacterium]|nr:hypothetical protein [Planctomycetota bacterium]
MLTPLAVSLALFTALPPSSTRGLAIDRDVAAPPPPAASSRPAGQSGRLIWDYRDTAPSKVSLPDYHAWLLDYCRSQVPTRLVLYVTSPLNPGTGFCDFYDPTAAPRTDGTLNLAGFLSALGADATTNGIEVQLLIDSSSFRPGQSASCGGWTPQPVDPTIGGIHPPTLPGGFPAFATALDWFGTLAANHAVAGGVLHGLVIDPEDRQNTGSVADDYASLAVWMDMYRTGGPTAVRSMAFGMTVGVPSHTLAKLLTTDLPVPAGYSVSPLAGFLSGGSLTYRATTTPVLDSIYMQVYSGCQSATGPQGPGTFFRWICEGGCDGGTTGPRTAVAPWTNVPETSANLLASTLQRRPELPGPGTITATANPNVPNPDGGNPGGSDLVGVQTRFETWPEAARVQLVDGATRIPPAPWAMLNAATSATATSVNGAQTTQSTPLPYVYTEISVDYAVPSTTPGQVDRFWFLFSAEKADITPFFGYWAYGDFVSFLQSFDSVVTTTAGAPFADASGNPIATSLQVGIYSLHQACLHWGTDFYPEAYPGASACLADLDGDGQVDAGDLGRLLAAWGTADVGVDLDRDGTVDGDDLATVLAGWGACP